MSEVDAACEFSDDHNVHCIADNIASQGRSVTQRFKDDGGTEVGKQSERTSDPEQTGFGAVAAGLCVPFGAAYRTEQNRVGGKTLVDGFLRERNSGGIDRTAAEQCFCICNREVEFCGGLIKHLYSFIDDLGTDTVTLEQRNVIIFHSVISPFSKIYYTFFPI